MYFFSRRKEQKIFALFFLLDGGDGIGDACRRTTHPLDGSAHRSKVSSIGRMHSRMDVCRGPLQAREDPRSSSSTFELDLLEDFVTVRSKAIYEEAQACSSQRTGGSLYASSTSKSSSWNTQGMPPNRTFQPSSSMQAGSSGAPPCAMASSATRHFPAIPP